jgi:putative membrane protein
MTDSEPILVLVIDVDDDLGNAGIQTPIIGEEEILKAVQRFALQYPEDSDVNAIYQGVKLYRELKKTGSDAYLAVLAGDPVNSVKAHMRILSELDKVLNNLGLEKGKVRAIIVTDGAEDETVIPVISNVIKVISVKRIVVTQHVGIETTYVILGRLIKKAIFEPRFSKYFVGVPGLILLVGAILAIMNWFTYVIEAGAVILALAMIVRGFSLEPYLEKLAYNLKTFFIPGGEHYHLIVVANATLTLNTVLSLFLIYYNWNVSEDIVHRIGYILGYPLIIFGFGVLAFQIGRLMVYMDLNKKKMYDETLKILVTITLMLAGYVLGDGLRSLPTNPSSDLLSTVILESGFLQILFGGLGIIAMLYVYLRVTGKYEVISQSSSEYPETSE